jgi:hypothetical protein
MTTLKAWPSIAGKPAWLAAAATILWLLIAAAPADAAKHCGSAGTRPIEGLGAVRVTTEGTSCTTARRVARYARVGAEGAKVRTRIAGRLWTCVVTQAATGTDPGYIPRSKVRCRSGGHTVRFQLQS